MDSGSDRMIISMPSSPSAKEPLGQEADVEVLSLSGLAPWRRHEPALHSEVGEQALLQHPTERLDPWCIPWLNRLGVSVQHGRAKWYHRARVEGAVVFECIGRHVEADDGAGSRVSRGGDIVKPLRPLGDILLVEQHAVACVRPVAPKGGGGRQRHVGVASRKGDAGGDSREARQGTRSAVCRRAKGGARVIEADISVAMRAEKDILDLTHLLERRRREDLVGPAALLPVVHEGGGIIDVSLSRERHRGVEPNPALLDSGGFLCEADHVHLVNSERARHEPVVFALLCE
eukprot:scaffold207403_cov31-Tisochrysis_lutea.AAC.3